MEIQDKLPQHFRFVGTSLCGYGETEETRSLIDNDIRHEVRVIEAVARRIGEPVHLVGHSFGGAVALAAALSGKIEVLSLTTFEANPLLLIKERGQQEMFDDTKRMSEEFEAAHEAGERDAAGRIIDFWGGDGSFAGMPRPVQEYCRATCFANVLDWRTALRFEAKSTDYAMLKMPVLLVRGALANPAMVEITNALGDCLPNSQLHIVDNANHFLIATHARDCASVLARFFEEVTTID
jgi:pimeloyl-ACP methyl ester carboxylesterase